MYVNQYSGQTSVQFPQVEHSQVCSICKTIVIDALGKKVAEILEKRDPSIFNEKLISDLAAAPEDVAKLLGQAAEAGDTIARGILENHLAPTLASYLPHALRDKLSELQEEKKNAASEVDNNNYQSMEGAYDKTDETKSFSMINSLDFQSLSLNDDNQLLSGILIAAINESLGSAIASVLVEKANGDPAFLEKTFREFRSDPHSLGKIIKECAAMGDEKAKSFIKIMDDGSAQGSDHLFATASKSVDVLIKHIEPYNQKAMAQYHLGMLYIEKGNNEFAHGWRDDASNAYFMALNNLNLASMQGLLDATYELGNLYLKGHRANKEYKQSYVTSNAQELAIECYKTAARGDHLLAITTLNNLGIVDFSAPDQAEMDVHHDHPRSPSPDDPSGHSKRNKSDFSYTSLNSTGQFHFF